MSAVVDLPANARTDAGKGSARAVRRAGYVPAVIYGNKQEPVMVSVDPKTLLMELSKTGFFTKLVDIRVNGETHRVLPRDVQFHPVTDEPIHVDFLRVLAGTEITVAVPVVFINEEESPGIKRGGVLNVVRHEIELVCTAENIPQAITIDLTGLEIGDSLHIGEITLPDGVKPAVADRDFTVATVAAPTVKAEEDAAAQAALAEEVEEELEEGAEDVAEGEAPDEEGKEEAAAGEDKKDKKEEKS